MSGYEVLEARMGYTFRDRALLRRALTHPSITYDSKTRKEHNQRLEFLGDAVLQLVLTRQLFERFPHAEEGPLTKARATLVNRRSLARQARLLELGASMELGRGEDQGGGRERESNLADCFEALLGAVFLDGGLPAVEAVLLRCFAGDLNCVDLSTDATNPKGELQELLQTGSRPAPQYRLVSASGPDHDRRFECLVMHEGRELARGQGRSKQLAEADAASNALRELRGETRGGE